MAQTTSGPSSYTDEPVTVAITAAKDPIGTDETEYLVMTTVKPPTGSHRTPSDVICIVDVSGSMSTEASFKSAGGVTESHGLSVLDIVKHAVKTIIQALEPQDRLAVVAYSDNATVVYELTPMQDAAKTDALNRVEQMYPDASTNLWDGLYVGLELVRKESKPGRLSTLLLLTDGMPNVSPPEGELGALIKYKDQHGISTIINTFGFGYSMNSQLLRNIAIEGNGMYAFIPDSSFVGTIFVNAITNILSTVAKNVNLSLEPENGAKLLGVIGGYSHQITSWGASINLCSLQYGQSKNVVVRMSVPKEAAPGTSYLTATLKYEHRASTSQEQTSAEGTAKDGGVEVEMQRHRLALVDAIRTAMELAQGSQYDTAVSTIKTLIEQAESCKHPHAKVLLEDLRGQVIEALSKAEYYTKWGVHYLPSLMCAHLHQQCNNFKDPGVQVYGGALFKKIRDEIDEIFIKLPPPKPSGSSSSGHGTPSSMSAYYCSANPCFHGDSQVSMADGVVKSVSNVKKGDRVKTPTGCAEVICVVKTVCAGGKTELVELEGGLLVTPYHPIRIGSKWHFPCDLGKVAERNCEAVYSFVVGSEHVMIINGVECVTLGHGFQDDVVNHPYFGTDAVISDLRKMRGWNSGLIELKTGCLIRDAVTGLVCGMRDVQSSIAA